MKKKPKTGILQRFFKIICLAVTLTSAGFLIYHMVYLPMENKKLVAELKGNFPEPEAPGASGSEKKDQPAGRKCPVAAVDLVSLREQYPDVQGWLTIPDTGIDYPVLQSEQENGEFYLKRNYKKEYDINGSLFLQADTVPEGVTVFPPKRPAIPMTATPQSRQQAVMRMIRFVLSFIDFPPFSDLSLDWTIPHLSA